jgi:glycosyltransferase involved in cell wall biosynthesis
MIKKHVIIIRNAKSYDFGGGERFPVFLSNILMESGFEPVIISRSPKLLAFAQDNSIKTIRGWWWSQQTWSGKFALLFPIYIIWQLILTLWYLGIFISKQADIIHIQSKDDFIAATFAGRLLGKQVIWTDHADLKHIWKNINIWYKNPVGKLVYFAAEYAQTITVVSKSEQKLVGDNLTPNSSILKKLRVIYNGVTDVSSQYKKTGDNNIFSFCAVSRLVTDKGLSELIEAFLKLSSEYDNLQLILVGNGPEEDKFKTLAKDNKHIKFLGYQKDPFSYIVESDVYVHPTYHEGFSVSIVEACMLEKPIIATSVGGNTEIIYDHQTGLLIPTKDTTALYNAMKLLYKDKVLRQSIAKNARTQYLKQFQFDQIVKDSFIPLYEGDEI